jgi:hypothetical protein
MFKLQFFLNFCSSKTDFYRMQHHIGYFYAGIIVINCTCLQMLIHAACYCLVADMRMRDSGPLIMDSI